MKIFKRILIMCLALTCALLSACSFNFELPDLPNFDFSGCSSRPVRPNVEPAEQVEVFTVDFIQDKSTLYFHPTVSGYITRTDVPDKITLLIVEHDFEYKLTESSLSFEDGAYKIGFEEEFTFKKGVPKDSTLTFKICVYKDGSKTILPTAETYTASSTLFWLSGYNLIEGRYFYILDSEYNWTDWV